MNINCFILVIQLWTNWYVIFTTMAKKFNDWFLRHLCISKIIDASDFIIVFLDFSYPIIIGFLFYEIIIGDSE